MAQIIAMIITAVVSVASLVLSIVNYFSKKPHLRIKINDKNRDCFYTIVGSEDSTVYHYVSNIHFNIVNDSPVKITINDIYLSINKEIFLLIDTESDYWNSIVYLIEDGNGEFGRDEIYRDVRKNYIKLPLKIDPYDSVTLSAIFNSTQNNLGNRVKAKMVLTTAIGTISKKVILSEYGLDHLNYELDNISQFQRSIVDIEKIKFSKDYEEDHEIQLQNPTIPDGRD